MLPITFPQVNKIYAKPPSMTDEQCGELPVAMARDINGVPCTISCWQLSYEDLQEIQKTGVVWVNIVGFEIIPFHLQTENPFILPPNE